MSDMRPLWRGAGLEDGRIASLRLDTFFQDGSLTLADAAQKRVAAGQVR